MSNILLPPNPKQELVMNTKCNRIILSGAQRAGKTLAAMMKIKQIALKMPTSRILVCRRTLKEIKENIYDILFNPENGILIDSSYGVFTESKGEYKFRNGSIIIFKQLDKVEKLLGPEYNVIYFGQAEFIPKMFYDYAIGRLTYWGNLKNPASKGWRYIQKYGRQGSKLFASRPAHFFILDCNPNTASWIYEYFIKKCPNYHHLTPHLEYVIEDEDGNPEIEEGMHKDNETRKRIKWDIFNFQTRDNIAGVPNIESYILETKVTANETYYRRYIEGEWIGAEGIIYDCFIAKSANEQGHIISDFKYSKDRYDLITAIDTGSSWYTGIIFGAFDKKTQNYIIYNEIKVKQTLIPEICDLIKNYLKADKIDIDDVQFIIDAAANAPESNGASKSDQYKQQKIYVRNANKTLEGALDRINSLFKQNRIYITGNCISLLKDLQTYSRNNKGKPNKGFGENAFDLADSFRYFLNEYAGGGPEIKAIPLMEQIDKSKSLSDYDKHISKSIWIGTDYNKPNTEGGWGTW